MKYKAISIPIHDGSSMTAYELEDGTQTWEVLPGLWSVSPPVMREDEVLEATTGAMYLLYQPKDSTAELWSIKFSNLHVNVRQPFASVKAFLAEHPEFVRPNLIHPTA